MSVLPFAVKARERPRVELNPSDVLEIVGPVGPSRNSMPSVMRTRAEKLRMSWETAGHDAASVEVVDCAGLATVHVA